MSTPRYKEFYEWDYTPAHEEIMQRMDEASDWFDYVTAILYGKKPLDLVDLENALDELGHLLQRKLPSNDLKITVER